MQRHVPRDRQILGRRAQHPAYVGAVDELHDQHEVIAHRAEIEHLNNVGVFEQCGEARLVDEHPYKIGITRKLRENSLQGDALREAVKTFTTRNENLGHSPRRQATLAAHPS